MNGSGVRLNTTVNEGEELMGSVLAAGAGKGRRLTSWMHGSGGKRRSLLSMHKTVIELGDHTEVHLVSQSGRTTSDH